MDLFEYQARDIFEATGCPVLRGVTATTPEEARRRPPEQLGTPVVVVKAQVKTGGRGKAGGVKLARTPEEAGEKAAEILGMDIKGHTVETVMVAEGADIAEEYYFSLPARPRQPPLPGDVLEGGRHGDRAARRRASRGAGPDPGRPAGRHRRGEGRARSSPPAGFAADVADEVARRPAAARQVYEGEDATLVEVNPLVKTGCRRDRRPRRQGHPRRERRVPAPRPRGAGRHLRGGPARGGGQGEGPQLRQARRLGRHHRQRRRPGHDHARRRRVRRRGAPGEPKPANFLDIGGGACAEVMANGLEIILGDPQVQERLRQRLRRHHRLRRGRQRHRAGASRCSTAAARRSTKPLVVRLDGNNAELGRRILDRRRPRRARAGGHDGRRRRAAPPSWPRPDPCHERRDTEHDMAIFLNEDPRSSSRA